MKSVYDIDPTPACMANHIGLWMIEPHWFGVAVESYKAGTYIVPQASADAVERMDTLAVDSRGTAVISIEGLITKGDSKFGGTNSIRVRRAIRPAAADSDVKAIMLKIDSPGGTVAGIEELAADIKAARLQKPVFAHIDDFGASAAFWIAAMTESISANSMAEIGSIGVVSVIEDSSEAAEKEGVVVHVLSSGPFKGAGVPGTVITAEHLAVWQALVDDIHQSFVSAVATGRGMSEAAVQEIADGRMHLAPAALKMGLIDRIALFDDALAAIGDRTEQAAARSRRLREARISVT